MKKPRALGQEQALFQLLGETERALAAARSGFDHVDDPDLLEYYLYEVSALRAKHSYLLRQVKAQRRD